jgi:hypothetical protein
MLKQAEWWESWKRRRIKRSWINVKNVFRHLPGGTEETHKNPHSVPATFEPVTSGVYARGVIA